MLKRGSAAVLLASWIGSGCFDPDMVVPTFDGGDGTAARSDSTGDHAPSSSSSSSDGGSTRGAESGTSSSAGETGSADSGREPECGDGIVDSETEECDDGNDVDDDGCSNTCRSTEASETEGPVPAPSCPQDPDTTDPPCESGLCDANGACVDCLDDTDCETPPDLCFEPGTCDTDTGTCSFPAVDCGEDTACTQRACDPEDGACLDIPIREGDTCDGTTCDAFGACVFDAANSCDESGTRARQCTDHVCTSGVCTPEIRVENEACTRVTQGDECQGGRTCDTPGPCVFEGNQTCDETGTRIQSCIDRFCGGGVCLSTSASETLSCSRDTSGDTCGAGTTCSGFGACQFDDVCDETGIQFQTCTDRTCSGDVCQTSAPRTESRSCTRDTDGETCGTTTCGPFGVCGGFSEFCDESGIESRTCTDLSCQAGTCRGVDRRNDRPCFRDRNGMVCQQGPTCCAQDTCSQPCQF